MAQPSLDFVIVEHPEIAGEPLIIGVDAFESGKFNVWTGDKPEGLIPVNDKTDNYIKKAAPRKAAKK